MKKTKKMSVMLAMVLSVTLLFGATIPAQAADAVVMFEVQKTDVNLDMTVPSELPIVFNYDGTNTYPTNWRITNNSSIAGVHLVSVELSSGGSGWTLLGEEEDTKTLEHDAKAVKFHVGKPGELKLVEPQTSTVGSVAFTEDEVNLATGESQLLEFMVERGAFDTALTSHKAFSMKLTFAYN